MKQANWDSFHRCESISEKVLSEGLCVWGTMGRENTHTHRKVSQSSKSKSSQTEPKAKN